MGLYPIEVPAQELYSSDTTRNHRLGTRAIFSTDNGPVEAVYVKNATTDSLGVGLCVHHSATPWAVDTSLFGATNNAMGTLGLVGVLCASLPGSATESYAWAACRGPITSINVAATSASSNHNGGIYAINAGTANAVAVAATLATGNAEITRVHVLGIGGGATTTIATTGGAGPAFINLNWR